MKNKKGSQFIVLIVLALAVFLVKKGCNKSTKKEAVKETRGLNRNPSHINFSKHAQCRMECRHITETEIKDVIQNGNINYKKSDVDGRDCNKKYAVEGMTKDNQRVRIIVAPCNDEATIVTCIDLGTDWECHCPGDENK